MSNSGHNQIFKKLTLLRRELKIRQEDAASYFNLGKQGRNTFRKWETGEKSPDVIHRTRFAHYLYEKLKLTRRVRRCCYQHLLTRPPNNKFSGRITVLLRLGKMSKELLIRMEIPITHPFQKMIVFKSWIPLNEEDFIIINKDNLELKLWFDVSCTHGYTKEDIFRTINVKVNKIFVDVTVKNLSKEFIEYILVKCNDRAFSDLELGRKYVHLAEEILETSVYYVNRLISYIRVEKGQYWLEEYSHTLNKISGDYVRFKTKARVKEDNSEWFVFDPPTRIYPVKFHWINEERFINQEDWPQVTNYLTSIDRRSNLVLELLANSEQLANIGHRRTSLIEAISALEVAVTNFSKKPKLSDLLKSNINARIDTKRFYQQSEHLGFSGTFKYLIPIMFPEEILPTDLLKDCFDALEARNNIIHSGQRDLDRTNMQKMLTAIRKICSILKAYTE